MLQEKEGGGGEVFILISQRMDLLYKQYRQKPSWNPIEICGDITFIMGVFRCISSNLHTFLESGHGTPQRIPKIKVWYAKKCRVQGCGRKFGIRIFGLQTLSRFSQKHFAVYIPCLPILLKYIQKCRKLLSWQLLCSLLIERFSGLEKPAGASRSWVLH